MNFLEQAWEQREEECYKAIFGGTGKGIYPLPANIFTDKFGFASPDPRWLRHGVFECPPTNKQHAWVYITSGMSNPWESDQKETFSGLGVEFVIEAEENSSLYIEILHGLMAYNLLLSVGYYGKQPLLDYCHRVPVNISQNLSHVVFAKPKQLPANFDLVSGKVDLLQLVGITPEELAFAKSNSSAELVDIIFERQGSLIMLPKRRPYLTAKSV